MTRSLLFLVFAFVTLLVQRDSSVFSVQGGYLGKLEQVLVGTTSQSLKLAKPREKDGGEPDQPQIILCGVAAVCLCLLLGGSYRKARDARPDASAHPTDYNLLAPPLRAPPVA